MATGVVVLALGVLAGCGGGSEEGPASPSPSTASPSPGTTLAPPTVTTTIHDGDVMTAAVPWQVKAEPVGNDFIAEVDFLIDGEQKWVERDSPYYFDDDEQVLPPWLLGNGQHDLAVRVTTTNGASAKVVAHVTVDVNLAQDQVIAGTYHRVVTKADVRRALPYRIPSKGAFGIVPPPGRWTLHFEPEGKIVGVDPLGDTSNPFVEPYTLTGSQLRLYGPAVWLQPNPDSPSLFCEPERPSDYTWDLSGSSLTITPTQKICADRDIVFAGTWTRAE
jgi:hypothetical protein